MKKYSSISKSTGRTIDADAPVSAGETMRSNILRRTFINRMIALSAGSIFFIKGIKRVFKKPVDEPTGRSNYPVIHSDAVARTRKNDRL